MRLGWSHVRYQVKELLAQGKSCASSAVAGLCVTDQVERCFWSVCQGQRD